MADLATLDKLTEYIAQNSTVATPSPTPASVAPPVVKAPAPSASVGALPAPEAKRFGPFKPIETGVRGTLTPRQQAHLTALIARYTARFPESKRQTQAHRAHLADPRTAGSFNRLWKEMVFPIVVERSAGARIWDVDGNEWIDHVDGLRHEPARPLAGFRHAGARGAARARHRSRPANAARGQGRAAALRAHRPGARRLLQYRLRGGHGRHAHRPHRHRPHAHRHHQWLSRHQR